MEGGWGWEVRGRRVYVGRMAYGVWRVRSSYRGSFIGAQSTTVKLEEHAGRQADGRTRRRIDAMRDAYGYGVAARRRGWPSLFAPGWPAGCVACWTIYTHWRVPAVRPGRPAASQARPLGLKRRKRIRRLLFPTQDQTGRAAEESAWAWGPGALSLSSLSRASQGGSRGQLRHPHARQTLESRRATVPPFSFTRRCGPRLLPAYLLACHANSLCTTRPRPARSSSATHIPVARSPHTQSMQAGIQLLSAPCTYTALTKPTCLPHSSRSQTSPRRSGETQPSPRHTP